MESLTQDLEGEVMTLVRELAAAMDLTGVVSVRYPAEDYTVDGVSSWRRRRRWIRKSICISAVVEALVDSSTHQN